ncbi:hypothetical protein G7046_g966 [Stylonectria norvegica]|nr:hypothetical protein G7046_g966 [Stylonectria norvegica]
MPVTEFALLKLEDGYDDANLVDILKHTQEVQDQWVRQHHPKTAIQHISTFFIQKAEAPLLIILAPWESVEAHQEWIESQENKEVFPKLSAFPANFLALFHLEPAGREPDFGANLFAKDELSIAHVTVKSNEKQAVQSAYESVEGQVGQGNRIWAGWWADKVDETQEDLFVFWSRGIPNENLQDLLDLSKVSNEIREFHHLA